MKNEDFILFIRQLAYVQGVMMKIKNDYGTVEMLDNLLDKFTSDFCKDNPSLTNT